jgi:hypothetical protein
MTERRARENVVGLERARSLEPGNAADGIFMSIIHRIERSEGALSIQILN